MNKSINTLSKQIKKYIKHEDLILKTNIIELELEIILRGLSKLKKDKINYNKKFKSFKKIISSKGIKYKSIYGKL